MQSISNVLVHRAKTAKWEACVEVLRKIDREGRKKKRERKKNEKIQSNVKQYLEVKCGHLIIYVNQSGCPLFQRHMVHRLC